jgi:hypothetical protein
MANELYFIPSDLLGTEKAWNWYNCYNNWNDPYPWLAALAWVKYAEQEKRDFSSVAKAPDFKYFQRLMQIIPLGIADGSLSGPFATTTETIQWLMRSVALEESLLQQGKMPTEQGVYIQQSKVKALADLRVQKALNIARTQGVAAARNFLNTPVTETDLASTSTQITLPKTAPLPGRTTSITRVSTLRGPEDANQSNQAKGWGIKDRPLLYAGIATVIAICSQKKR